MRPANGAMEAWLLSETKPAPAGRGELGKRVLSAAVLAPVALAAELAGGIFFAVLVILVAVIALREWTVVTDATEPRWLNAIVLACLVASLLAITFLAARWALGLIGAATLLAMAFGTRSAAARWMGIGLLYVALPCAAILALRQAVPTGWAAVLFVLFVVWSTDTAAYFGGRSIGGPKLWPRVSPKKTWSGALTGLLAAVLTGGVTVWLTRAGAVSTGLLLAAPLSVAAQAGDFLESALKRRFGVKDSSRLIPGHGGVLDRVDGLFTAAALAWLIAALGWGGDLLVLPGNDFTGGAS
jgi:phosphatidate cytidylyltransferase